MRRLLSGLMALLMMITVAQSPAYAGSDTVHYKPGVIEQALAKGETVLLHYKTTW